MRAIQKKIKVENYNQSIRIIFWGDTHIGSSSSDIDAWSSILRQFRDDPNTYDICMGDVVDAIVGHDDKRWKLSQIDKSIFAEQPNIRVVDAILDWQIDQFVNIYVSSWDPRKNIAFLVGNHEEKAAKYHGSDVSARIVRELERKMPSNTHIELLGVSGFITLSFDIAGGSYLSLMIYVHHGYGGSSRTIGGDLTKYEKGFTYYAGDVHAYGHVHKLIAVPYDYARPDASRKKIVCANRWLLLTGSFHKSFSLNSKPNYSEEKGLPPRTLGAMLLEITPRRCYKKPKHSYLELEGRPLVSSRGSNE